MMLLVNITNIMIKYLIFHVKDDKVIFGKDFGVGIDKGDISHPHFKGVKVGNF